MNHFRPFEKLENGFPLDVVPCVGTCLSSDMPGSRFASSGSSRADSPESSWS